MVIAIKRLREVRKKKGLTQKQVAEHIGITQNAYSYWETGRNKIDNESLNKLADFFGVSVDYLLGRDTTEGGGDPVDPEVLEYIDELKKRDDLQMLIVAARDVTKEDIEKAIKIIQALKD
jgi:transcriptional regulator with XRE-family HTH domain